MSAGAERVSTGEKLTTEEMLREASRLQAETIYLQAQRNLEQARRGTAGELKFAGMVLLLSFTGAVLIFVLAYYLVKFLEHHP